MSSLTPFSFDSREIRVLTIAGDPWFVAKDVAEALEYSESSNPARLFASVPDEWKGVNPIHTLGGIQEMLTLSEPGLYFFLGRSDKPKALPFQKWAAGEVFPTIRKTGGYALPGTQPQPADPATLAQQLADLLKGKIAVDRAEWTTVRQGIDALREAFGWLDRRAETIERTAVRFPAAPREPRARQRPAAPPDPWEPQVRAYVAGRQEVTSTLVLTHLGVPTAEQTQVPKNRIAKILIGIGFVGYRVKRAGSTRRIWQRHHHA